MNYNKLDKNAKKSWFISGGIATIIVTVILLVVKWFFTYKINVKFFINWSFYINIIIGIIVLLSVLDLTLGTLIEYAQWKYIITNDKVEFSEGIYYTKTTVIPIVRIQHIKINQGPINKMLNLADIHMYTAGGEHEIPNLSIEKANEISEYLKDKIKEKVDKDDR